MSFVYLFVIIYSSISLLSLFNKRIRDLYLGVIDIFHSEIKLSYNKKDYLYTFGCCILYLLVVFLCFILAPIAIIILWYLFQGNKNVSVSSSELEELKPIKKEYIKPPLIVKIKKEIPFTPDNQQVIYFENSINVRLNKYIANEYQKIYDLLKKRGFYFVYFPKLLETIGIEEARYLNPTIAEQTITSDKTVIQIINNKILSFIDAPGRLTGGLLRYKEDSENYYIFTYYQFTSFEDIEIWEQIRAYQSVLGGPGKYYSISPPYIEDPDDNADYNFDLESKKLITEIRDRIEVLKQKGVSEMVLKTLFPFNSVKLSRLVITKEYKIFLTDYNNLEIEMYPLPKAVFFLFLNHPEGILFKNLPDYRDELIAIYKKISGRENIRKMEKSIDDVVNPTLNSINEKCSRIREAFIKHFDESLAKNYFITGERATPKKIILDRNLIKLEDVDIKANVVKTPFDYKKNEHKNNKSYNDDFPF